MPKFIKNFLNNTTMYRLVLYYLVYLLAAAFILSWFQLLPYNPFLLFFSAVFFTVACWLVNVIFARVFSAPTNIESAYITALILALIIAPMRSMTDGAFLSLAIWASVWAMASKYILAINKKHVFNPAAFAVALTALTLNQSATWWVGTAWMFPFVLLGGVLVVKKILRWDLVVSFLAAGIAVILWSRLPNVLLFPGIVERALLYSPLLFFAFVMLTEPLTTPPTKTLRIYYGALVGFLFSPAIHLGWIYSTPELALLAGNIFSYAVSPKQKLLLILRNRVQASADVYDFIFKTDRRFSFSPGQYLEWTLAHHSPDNRGNRRYFTIASAPTEVGIRMGVKFYEKSSSYKIGLLALRPGDSIVASQLAGDFVLPKNQEQKIVLMAGGIGVTPFRSMIKYLIDRQEKRPIILFYLNKTIDDIAYRDVFDQAKQVGIKVVYVLTTEDKIPAQWRGQRGRLSAAMIEREVPDFRQRLFYLSGPQSMVDAYDGILNEMGVNGSQIKKDFFPGFA